MTSLNLQTLRLHLTLSPRCSCINSMQATCLTLGISWNTVLYWLRTGLTGRQGCQDHRKRLSPKQKLGVVHYITIQAAAACPALPKEILKLASEMYLSRISISLIPTMRNYPTLFRANLNLPDLARVYSTMFLLAISRLSQYIICLSHYCRLCLYVA
jgi:hypothetical protein